MQGLCCLSGRSCPCFVAGAQGGDSMYSASEDWPGEGGAGQVLPRGDQELLERRRRCFPFLRGSR